MKKMFINVWPNGNNQLSLEEFIPKYSDCEFENPEFRYTDKLNKESAIDVLMLSNIDRMITNLKSHNVDVEIRLTHSSHPTYNGYLMYIKSNVNTGNINPIVAKFFTWERIEHQDVMKYIDFALL